LQYQVIKETAKSRISDIFHLHIKHILLIYATIY